MWLKTNFSADPVHSGAWTEALPAKYLFVDRAELIQITDSLRAASPKCCMCIQQDWSIRSSLQGATTSAKSACVGKCFYPTI